MALISEGETAPGDERRADGSSASLDGFARKAARLLEVGEDLLYVSAGLVLVLLAAALLIAGVRDFAGGAGKLGIAASSFKLLGTALLVLIIAELLATMIVWLRDHTLPPDPFLMVALTAAVRRILLITAQDKLVPDTTPDLLRLALLELAILTVLVFLFVAALIALHYFRRRRDAA